MIEKSLPFTDIVTSRAFSYIEMTSTVEGALFKFVYPSVIFPDQLESPNLDVCRRIYGQNMITAQS